MLAALTCFYNPCGYRNLANNYWRFRQELQGVELFTAELSFDGRFMVPDALQFRGTARNVMWQKERLLNILIDRLPARFDAVAWIDADLLFRNPNWAAEAYAKLAEFPVVQLFERVEDLDAFGHVRAVECGWSKWSETADPNIAIRRPGGAWAARRDALAAGLDDMHVLGGSDAMMLSAWQGDWRPTLTQYMSRGWKLAYLQWAARAYRLVQNRIGYCSGDVVHLYHGSRPKRKYVERWAYLKEYGFDPTQDLAHDWNGLWRWNSEKVEMHQKVANYFRERDEDEIVSGEFQLLPRGVWDDPRPDELEAFAAFLSAYSEVEQEGGS